MVEPSGDVLLLTYVELGERLGVAPDTARLRAKRRGWEVQHGNDGKAKASPLDPPVAVRQVGLPALNLPAPATWFVPARWSTRTQEQRRKQPNAYSS